MASLKLPSDTEYLRVDMEGKGKAEGHANQEHPSIPGPDLSSNYRGKPSCPGFPKYPVIAHFALMYIFGETYLEHRPRSFLASLEWAAETLTTTGYGEDSRRDHPLMVIMVVLTQFSGLFLLFLIIPFYLLPYLEERFEARLPHVLPKFKDYVLIFHYSPAVASLIEELKRHGRQFVILEQNRVAARDARQRGLPLVLVDLVEDSLQGDDEIFLCGSPESIEVYLQAFPQHLRQQQGAESLQIGS